MATVQIGHLNAIDVRDLYPDDPAYETRDLDVIDAKIIHHSVTPAWGDPLAAIAAIYASHRRQGWSGIGYHLVVGWDGRIYLAGGAETIRAGVYGRNETSYHIVLLGDFTDATPDLRQLMAARRLLAELDYSLGRFIPTYGHRGYAGPGQGTACPGNTFGFWLGLLTDPDPGGAIKDLAGHVTGADPLRP